MNDLGKGHKHLLGVHDNACRNQAAALAEARADGDFTGTINVVRNDEIAMMATSLNSMTATLSLTINAISQSAGDANLISANAVTHTSQTSQEIKSLSDAARAGILGKGFAVVANEIKGLVKDTAEKMSELAERLILLVSKFKI